ncbi:MAG: SDR family oxidoreductase [Terrimonas sp.]|nr:SDR family oxidoreductase [Terrimonas sp.]
MKKIFEGKVALITGGSYGIGQATAIAFAKNGANIVVADKVQDENDETGKKVLETGAKYLFVKSDVSDARDVRALIKKAIEHFGRIDFAFNNAGIEGKMASTHECTEENWDTTIGVNLKGVFLCMKYEIPELLKNPHSVIVNCASVAGLKGFATLPAYTASKHAIVGLTKTAALEYAARGLRVNAVCPGVIHTDMIDRITGKDKSVEKQYTDMEPIGRMGKPQEIGDAVVWLCADAASFVTGIALPVDGGFCA